jgi:rubrerythrin
MDPVHFSGSEVVKMAVRIEENGMRFYSDASKATKVPRLKELFRALAEEEARHINAFSDIGDSLPEDAVAEGFDPYIIEASLYLKAMADQEVFTHADEGKKLAERIFDEREALDLAIDMEKDSLLFYYEMKKMIREKDAFVIEELIGQEKEHLKKLTRHKEELFGKDE